MKQLFFLPLILISLLNPVAAREPATVLDYYNMMPPACFENNKFAIRYEKGKYVSNSIVDYEIYPIVDQQNGYMFIEDPGTGGGTVRHEIAIFTDNSKNIFIGVHISSFDGVAPESRLKFFVYKKGTFRDTTASIFPKISSTDFMKENFDESLVPDIINNRSLYSIMYNLPRYGTKIKCDLFIASARIEAMLESKSDDDKKAYTDFLKKIQFKEVEINWDIKKSVFKIGKKK